MKPITLGLFHDAEGDRAAADLLDQAPEDVAAVERQEGEQVDDGEREADDGQDVRRRRASSNSNRLPRHLVAADHAR